MNVFFLIHVYFTLYNRQDVESKGIPVIFSIEDFFKMNEVYISGTILFFCEP